MGLNGGRNKEFGAYKIIADMTVLHLDIYLDFIKYYLI